METDTIRFFRNMNSKEKELEVLKKVQLFQDVINWMLIRHKNLEGNKKIIENILDQMKKEYISNDFQIFDNVRIVEKRKINVDGYDIFLDCLREYEKQFDPLVIFDT